MRYFFITVLTFLAPLLTPYGYWVFSYADPCLIGRDLLIDSMGRGKNLHRAVRLLITSIALVIVYFVLQKNKLAIISGITSITSESTDFLLTLKITNLKARPFITVLCNIFDSVLFMTLAIIFGALSEMDYNIFIDTALLAIVYFGIFYLLKHFNFFKDENLAAPRLRT